MIKILAQGAEAIISLNKNIIKKTRVKKSYRLPELDKKIRLRRTKSEAKILEKLSKIISVPKLIKLSEENSEIELEFIKGEKLSESLEKQKNISTIAKQIGENIAKVHNLGIIHGDLTTSNMIYQKETNSYEQFIKGGGRRGNYKCHYKLFFIDFGLSFFSDKIEDKAVDLHLIKEALKAKHNSISEKFFKEIIKSYSKIALKPKEVLKRLEIVEKRGRYKQAG